MRVVVVGLPTGGTSVTAGMLDRLGVQMGDWPLTGRTRFGRIPKRPYDTYECPLSRAIVVRAWQGNQVAKTLPIEDAMRDYKRYWALREERSPGLHHGLKHARQLYLADAPDGWLEDQGLTVVSVYRPSEEARSRDKAYITSQWTKTRGDFMTEVERLRDKFLERVPPAVTLDFNNLRKPGHAKLWAAHMAQKLGLEPSPQRIEWAASLVKPRD